MGFKKDWDLNNIEHQVFQMGINVISPYTDGFTAFEIKKDLYRLKWLVDHTLNRCSDFSGETEWLREQEQTKIVNILKS